MLFEVFDHFIDMYFKGTFVHVLGEFVCDVFGGACIVFIDKVIQLKVISGVKLLCNYD